MKEELTVDESAKAWTRPVVILPAFATLSLVGGFLPSLSLAASLYVLCLGGVLLLVGLTNKAARRPVPSRLPGGIAWWLLPIAIFVVVEVITFTHGSTYAYPTLSALADPLLDHYLVRSAAYFGWLTAFWGLVRR